MKHGTRFWEKKLGRTPSHRKSLLTNLLTELVKHEQIETTVAKAQFLKHEMEKMINVAKSGTARDWNWVQDNLNSKEVTVPKMMHILANRYKDKRGGYVRILKNGYRANASDRAPLAIVELVNNANDVVFHLAKREKQELDKQLDKIEEKRYLRKVVNLVDPSSGKPVQLLRIKERPDLKVVDKRKISGQERAIHKKLIKYNKSLESYPKTRLVDEESTEKLKSLTADESNPFFVPPADKLDESLPVSTKVKSVKRIEKVDELTGSSVLESAVLSSEKKVPKEAPPPPPPKSFLGKFFGRIFK